MNANCLFPSMLISLLMAAALPSQERAYGIFETQDEYYQFMGSVKGEGANNPELMAMVPMINDIVLGHEIGTTGKQYNVTNSTLGLLSNESVRKELEMVDEQFADLKKANAEIQRTVAEQLKAIDLTDMKSATAQILSIRDQMKTELQATLLPHQIERLRQIAIQNRLRERSLVEIITSEPMKTEFDISDKQSSDLKKAEKKIAAELNRQIAELHEKARKRLLDNLRSDQKQKVEDRFGDAFAFDAMLPFQPKPASKRGSKK